jgi:hypothetical protein
VPRNYQNLNILFQTEKQLKVHSNMKLAVIMIL